jgi:hypothetical protein
VTVAGVVNLICADCAVINGAWTLDHFSGCVWRSPLITYCAGSRVKRWLFTLTSAAAARLELTGVGTPTVEARYLGVHVPGVWGPWTMLLAIPGTRCTGFPAALTVYAAF